MLVKLGYEAHLVIMGGFAPNFTFHTAQDLSHLHPDLKHSGQFSLDEQEKLKIILDEGVTIYPEVVVGNPLGAKRIVRYFLNHDGAVTGHKSNFTKDDFILAYTSLYFKDPHHVLNKPITDNNFNDTNAPIWDNRTINATYIGKGSNYLKCHVIENTLEIAREWPATKHELSLLLKNTKYLYCWDNLTQLSADAILCGAKIVLLQDYQINRLSGQLGNFPYLIGTIRGNRIELNEYENYESDRKSFIEDYKFRLNNWDKNVNESVIAIVNFFL
ncbi:hypothetical protein CL55_00004780 [Polynucleobacter duraquae]|uniref:Uncharacterized protein n=1 Tax=Polynucleobacter duraquae TaxID=1835254 RepID=A0A0E3ZKU3_9BURK|nr:hypothetical protein [Polynucleobacter duraquae]AKD24811.1 hypothetical protein CL55_00004780 [Polynucleobacter duraquae]